MKTRLADRARQPGCQIMKDAAPQALLAPGDAELCYSELATVLNVPLRLVPTVATTPMMTTAMRAAISPYSMAVTPDSSVIKRDMILLI